MGSVTEKLSQKFTNHNAILVSIKFLSRLCASDSYSIQRRFALENQHLLVNEEAEDEDGVDNSSDVTEDDAQTGQKRKRTKTSKRAKAGRIPNGEDFWSQVDAWFVRQVNQREKDFGSPLWRRYVFKYCCFICLHRLFDSYIEETIILDNNKYDCSVARPTAVFPAPLVQVLAGSTSSQSPAANSTPDVASSTQSVWGMDLSLYA